MRNLFMCSTVLALALGGTACNPGWIRPSVDLQYDHACPGTSVRVEWRGGNSTTEVFSPSGVRIGSGPSGAASFVASGNGDVRVGSGSSVTRRRFTVLSEVQPVVFTTRQSCGVLASLDGLRGVHAVGFLDGRYDARYRLERLRVSDGRRSKVLLGTTLVETGPSWMYIDGLTLPSRVEVDSWLQWNETCSSFPSSGDVAAPNGFSVSMVASCH